MTYFEDLAKLPIGPFADANTLGTLMFALSFAAEFVLLPDIWPVYMDWYKRSFPGADPTGLIAPAGKLELQDMVQTARTIALASQA